MSSSKFTQAISSVLNNPSRIQSTTLTYLRDVLDGEVEFIDPSNPFVAALECSAHHTAAAVENNRILTRRQYARVAQSQEDLYTHMADIDYLDRFAQPASAKFTIVMSLVELRKRMLEDSSNGYRKVVLPRNTVFNAMDTYFSLSYPVEIREMRHGGITIVYDYSQPNPVQELETNVIQPYVTTNDGVDYISFEVDVLQYRIVTSYETITPSSSFSIKRTISDQFFFARVWFEQTDGSWKEIHTTHSDLYFDPDKSTALIKVLGKDIQVSIPQIYVHDNNIIGRVRVDIYETLGPLFIDLGGYSQDAFSAQWLAIDKADQTPYVSVLDKFEILQVFSASVVTGGRDAISFEELRRRVIMNDTGPKHRPISPDQIRTALVDKNYTIVKNIENLTNRVFLASRNLPRPSNDKLITQAALSIQSSVFSMDDIRYLESVIDNGNSVTITPDSVFQNTNSIVRILSQSELDEILSLSSDQLAIEVTNGNYYYTPFYYVLEYVDEEFDVRAYYLDNSSALGKSFVAENATVGMSVSTSAYELKKTDTGFELLVSTKSDDVVKALGDDELFAQLAFTPQQESNQAYLLGQLVGRTDEGERIFRFALDTNFHITRRDGLQLTSFEMFNDSSRIVACRLLEEFNLYYITTANPSVNWTPSDMDLELGAFQLPAEHAAIQQERIRVRLGYALDNLWKRARNFAGTEVYERYSDNVYATYTKDVYKTDPVTGSSLKIENGEVSFELLHSKGDPVLDDEGNPVILHYKGDVKLDAMGEPIRIRAGKMQIQTDFMLVEGVYKFSNDPVVESYRKELASVLVEWITNDLKSITPELLEKTSIYFYPQTTTGLINVMFDAGLVTSINASQGLRVDLYVDDKVHSNESLRQQIRIKTIKEINEIFKKDVVSISELTSNLRSSYGRDVIDVRVSGLGGTQANYPVVSMMSETDRLSLRKRLKARPDGILLVEEDIVFNFVRHRLDKSDNF